MADLIYAIADQILQGTLGGIDFRIFAGSGGRAGSTKSGARVYNVANNPFMTDIKYVKGDSVRSVGGPIPVGLYNMEIDTAKERKGKKWIKLKAESSTNLFTRSGFYIHGRGEIGSQGCIVPYSNSDLFQLWSAVKKNNGGTLMVVIGNVDSVRV